MGKHSKKITTGDWNDEGLLSNINIHMKKHFI